MSVREPGRITQARKTSDNITLVSVSVNRGPGIETIHTKSLAGIPGSPWFTVCDVVCG